MSSSEAMPTIEDVKKDILEHCVTPRTKENILNLIGIEIRISHSRKYIGRLFEERYLDFTIPDKPCSGKQQYIISKKGKAYLKSLE